MRYSFMNTIELEEVIKRKYELIDMMSDPEQIKIMEIESNELKLLVKRRKKIDY